MTMLKNWDRICPHDPTKIERLIQSKMTKIKANVIPRIVLQFIRQGALDSDYGFELVTWWSPNIQAHKYDVVIEAARPTPAQIEKIHSAGSIIIIDKYSK